MDYFVHKTVGIDTTIRIGKSVKIWHLKNESDKTIEKTKVKKSVTLGVNTVTLSDIFMRSHSLIGAGSVVTKNVQAGVVRIGNRQYQCERIHD